MAKISKNDMTQLKSFAAPPQGVKDVLYAALVLLGDDIDARTDYTRVIRKSLVGLEKRCEALDASKVPLNVALGAKVLMKGATSDNIKNKSMAAHLVFLWDQYVIDTVLSQYSEEEISRTVPSTEKEPEVREAINL
ncbi:uncharacterized protein [Littorina saxatilis]|uniref:Uncharacterized protein n=1 Tax=Littorina saxatilis TaxID=31220 RepID=A0AAN9B0N0_9CAEN